MRWYAGRGRWLRRAAKWFLLRLSCLPVSLFDSISKSRRALEEWLDLAAELGLEGIECSPLFLRPLGPVTAAEFRRLTDSRGLAISNFTGYSDFTRIDPADREREVSAILSTMDEILELGAPSMRVLTGQQREGMTEDDGIAWVVASIRRVTERADSVGLQVNLENHGKAFTWTDFDFGRRGETFLRIMEALGDTSLGVQFDLANPIVAGEDPLDLFERVASRVRYVHWNDVAEAGQFAFVPLGTGIAPLRECVARLRKKTYSGWIGIEEASRTGRAGFEQAVRQARAVLSEEGGQRIKP